MKKVFIFFLFILSFILDILFFDYDLSDIKHFKEDVSEISKKIEKSLEFDLPFYFINSGFNIKNCKQYFTYNPTPKNVFEKEVLKNLHKKCNLLKILSYAKVSNSNFIDFINLTTFSNWDKELYFNYTCNKINYSNLNYYSNFNTTKDLIENNIVNVEIIDQNNIIVFNKVINKKIFIKEILRADFNEDKVKDILLEISVADPTDNYVECTNYIVFTRNNKTDLVKGIKTNGTYNKN